MRINLGNKVEACTTSAGTAATSSPAAYGGGEGEFTVKIVGSPSAITVPPSMVRVRQVLTDGDIWVATYKRRLANERPPPPLAAAAAAVGEQIHLLEVDAYGALMRVLHATGALSWEKEELLTQLRLQLHVSSDEHLQLIRALNGGRRRLPKPEN
uniref:ENT domain-containing protein n=1 Tax=Oryza barthii TaxID=65489 RepID=A0A0D3ER49_9ORYZ